MVGLILKNNVYSIIKHGLNVFFFFFVPQPTTQFEINFSIFVTNKTPICIYIYTQNKPPPIFFPFFFYIFLIREGKSLITITPIKEER